MNKETTEPSIQTFFAGRSVFITGATGFMGKVLIEKLLRSCPDIAEIFLLMRPKKGIRIVDRLNKVLDNKLFNKLRTEQPSSFDKLVPIMGDAAIVGLGLLPVHAGSEETWTASGDEIAKGVFYSLLRIEWISLSLLANLGCLNASLSFCSIRTYPL